MDDNEAETKPMTRRPCILVINPNPNEAVTEGLRQAVQPLNYAEGPEITCATCDPTQAAVAMATRRYSGRALRI
jgi:Asp/Glu/hydantoin racemase